MDGAQPEALQPDGTYGPIGLEGSGDFWAVDATGREVRGCRGAVAADGTCYLVQKTSGLTLAFLPNFEALDPSGSLIWNVTDPTYQWFDEFDVPVVARDGAGILYTAVGEGLDVATATPQAGRVIAVDPATHAILWGHLGPSAVLTALGSGVVASRPGGIVAYSANGTERWSRPLSVGQSATAASTVSDSPRGRVYVGRSGRGAPGVTALAPGTGNQAWRTRPRDRARLLSVGPHGRVYLAIDAPGHLGVRAVRARDGRTLWQRRSRLPVLGARELANGMVAVSAGSATSPPAADRLVLLDPRGTRP